MFMFKTLKPNGNYMYQLLKSAFCTSVLYDSQSIINSLNSVTQLIFVMVKCGVLFEVRTGFLNNI
jgi:hypothetical protein